MFIKKLPIQEQSLIVASSRINAFKKAVEELIYNALDAESTSIAIRVHIEQSSIQVIDNGCGITKKDLKVTGQRYMTSKYNDRSKSPKYGCRGESLSNIVEVSKLVRITSRYETSDSTWEKCFRNGKSDKVMTVDRRPSKGTTVEIKGFLYNLKIQFKSINALYELHEIKSFLGRISLVHCNVSLSLRDDSKNEIIFQLHKKRDIYQTILHLCGINKSEMQELKVEKNQYAVTAFIAKQIKDINEEWIFLNRKFVNNTSRLHKIVNDYLNKCLNTKYHRKKSKIMHDDEEVYLIKNKLPLYFLFIQCPIKDYDLIHNHVEFNNWDQITKLLEKLVKFYISDTNVKANTGNIDREGNKNVNEETREKVKEIMNKILASNTKKLGISQIQKGIKGKITKRAKKKHKTRLKFVSESNFITDHNKKSPNKQDTNIDVVNKNNPKHQPNITRKNKKQNMNKNDCSKILNNKKKKFENTDIQGIERDQNTNQETRHLKSKEKYEMTELINDFAVKTMFNPTHSAKRKWKILAQKAQEVLNHFNNKISTVYVDKSVQCSYKGENYEIIKTCKNEEYNHCNKLRVQQSKKTTFRTEHIKSNYDLLKPILNTQVNNYETGTDYQSVSYYKNRLIDFENNIHNVTNENEAAIRCHDYKFADYKQISNYTASEVINTGPIMTKLTYESHNCEVRSKKKRTNTKFMSRKSKDNFMISNDMRRQTLQNKYTYSRRLKKIHQSLMKDTTVPNINRHETCSKMLNIEEYSEIIDCSKNDKVHDEKDALLEPNTFLTDSNNCQDGKINSTQQNIYDNMDLLINQTYNLTKNHAIHNMQVVHIQESINYNSVFNQPIDVSNANIAKSGCIFTEESRSGTMTYGIDQTNEKYNFPSIQIPYSQKSITRKTEETIYTPMDVCEAIYLSNGLFEKEHNSFCNNNQKDLVDIDVSLKEIFDVDKDKETYTSQNNIKNTSHHFSNVDNMQNLRSIVGMKDKRNSSSIVDNKQSSDPIIDNLDKDQLNYSNHNGRCETIDSNIFQLKNRLHFVPKGMSPIFKNCNTKYVGLNFEEDYYNDDLYHNFINEVQANSEIYTEQVQNIKEAQLKNKCKSKTIADFSLNFDSESLENAKVLKQIDNKFIAAILQNSKHHNTESANFLVLFDQHAVHERVRLENNLSEYVSDDRWKSVPIENMTMLLPNEEILYLHNYKEKFAQLGLYWTMPSRNEVTITGIPEAIIGKNPRQADKIMQAVRNLITEQIVCIKSQNGCISLYPKTILELVYSEACRYAIMFGDMLTIDRCKELLKDLSKCKKPFQCAHGRPVMAVLIDLEYNEQKYKANLTNLKRFKVQ